MRFEADDCGEEDGGGARAALGGGGGGPRAPGRTFGLALGMGFGFGEQVTSSCWSDVDRGIGFARGCGGRCRGEVVVDEDRSLLVLLEAEFGLPWRRGMRFALGGGSFAKTSSSSQGGMSPLSRASRSGLSHQAAVSLPGLLLLLLLLLGRRAGLFLGLWRRLWWRREGGLGTIRRVLAGVGGGSSTAASSSSSSSEAGEAAAEEEWPRSRDTRAPGAALSTQESMLKTVEK